MDRLMERSPNGRAIYRNATPEALKENRRSVMEKCCCYEEMEERGRLFKLPCALGDAVYVVDVDPEVKGKYVETKYVDNIEIFADGEIWLKGDHYDDVICSVDDIVKGTLYLDYYRVFTDKEDAEKLVESLQS